MRIAVLGPCTVKGLAPDMPEWCDSDHPSGIVRGILDEYLASGHSVDVLKFNKNADRTQQFQADGLTVTLVPRRRKGYQLSSDLWGRERKEALRVLENLSPEVVHAHWTYEYARVTLTSGLPHLITAHDAPSRLFKVMRPRYYWWPRLAQGYYVAKKAKLMSAVSAYTTGIWKTEMHALCPVHTVVNGLKVQANHPSWKNSRQGGKTTYMYLADGFNTLKNSSTLLQAFSIVRQKNPSAVLALYGGDYGENQAAQRWAKENGLEHGVEFHGRRSHPEVFEALANASVYVHASLEESCSMAILEAMATGIPIVGGKEAGGVPWQLDEGKAGVLCDVKSKEALSAAMLEAADKPELGMAAWERFDRFFRIEVAAGHYLELLKGAAGQ